MTMITIRKNAFKKIQELLNNSVGVITSNSTSRIDDGHDTEYSDSSAAAAMSWLRANQERAQVYLEQENGHTVLRISGRYAFETSFLAYFDHLYFEKERAWFVAKTAASEPAPILPCHLRPGLHLVK